MFAYQTFSWPTYRNADITGDENDAVAKTLYQSVVVVSLYEKTKSEAFQKLDAATRKAIGEVDELKKYRSSYGGLNYFGAAYYDCIMYAAFLYNLSKSDGLHLNRDIFEISGLIANKTIFKGKLIITICLTN